MIRLSTLIWLMLSICAGGFLFNISQKTQDEQHKIASLKQDIQDEKDRLNVLEAEWCYLTTPERLNALSEKHLDLKTYETFPQLTPSQLQSLALSPPNPVLENGVNTSQSSLDATSHTSAQ